MESFIVRKICGLHAKQLRVICHSLRRFTTLNSHSQRPTNVVYRRNCSSKQGNPSKNSNEPFISPLKKPKNESDYQKVMKEARRRKSSSGGPNMYILGATAVGFAGLYFILKQQLKQKQLDQLKQSVSTPISALLGGEWELTNQDGQKVSNKDYEGDWCLIYFGFTHCPDICPDEIEKIVEVMDILARNPKLPKLRALFVTVDPDRDSPAALKTYLEEFSDKIVGLTGSMAELKKILNAFKVYYSMGPKDEDGDYIVDHSIIIYLMNPDGKYEAHFARSKTNIDVSNAVENKMITWSPKS